MDIGNVLDEQAHNYVITDERWNRVSIKKQIAPEKIRIKNEAIYLYTNSYNPILRREIVSEFLDTFFPVEKKKVKRDKSPGYDEYLQNFEGEYAAVQISKHTISKFRTYNTSIRIKKENKMLILESDKMDPYGDLEGRLEFIEIDPFLFRCLDREAYISFKMNEAGNVEYLLSGSGQHGAYRKLPLFETKTIHENLGIFFLRFFYLYYCFRWDG